MPDLIQGFLLLDLLRAPAAEHFWKYTLFFFFFFFAFSFFDQGKRVNERAVGAEGEPVSPVSRAK